ncbi:hypothetical protein HDR61_04435 [bacterium]|nr:hypothetical protein [bacterium]
MITFLYIGHIDMKILQKHWKQNKIESTLARYEENHTLPVSTENNVELNNTIDFLYKKFGIHDVQHITGVICNKFMIGTDKNGSRLFIKTGKHAGIYENEYKMGAALYDIDPQHFIRPLYFNDDDTCRFFANEYVRGMTLKTAIMTNSLTPAERSKIIGDLWRIFCALRASDVVHRDIRPDNLMIIDGRLVLIDFQLAVSKTNYIELEYLARRPNRLRKLGNKHFRYRPFVWDDAYSLLKVMEFIGRKKSYAMRYDIIYKQIKSYVGMDKIKSSVREGDVHRMVRHIRKLGGLAPRAS